MNQLHGLCLAAILLAISPLARAEQPVFDLTPPAELGFDADRLAEIDKLMKQAVEEGRVVGCVAVIARGEQVAYARTWGQRNREADVPMTLDTIFRIYSMSKPITSVAALQLVEQGKLSLDDPVSKHLPALGQLKVLMGDEEVEAEREMTVRDLMRHTSGLTYGFFGDTPVDKAYRQAGVLVTDDTLESTIAKLGKIPLLYQPGSRWHYSVSTDVLGRLVEVVSGQRFDEYLQEHLFDPLGMEDTFFVVPQPKLDRLAQMYRPQGDGLKPASAMESIRFVSPGNKFFSGGGGLCSTAKDYLRFCQALLNDGELDGQRILKKETVAEMIRNQLGNRRGFQFGLGVSISPQGDYSWGGAAGTRFWINPERDVIGIYMIQIKPYQGRDYGNQMKELVYAADRREESGKDRGASSDGTQPSAGSPK